MKTTTQAFQMIKIVKLYSWEDYFTKKITQAIASASDLEKQTEPLCAITRWK